MKARLFFLLPMMIASAMAEDKVIDLTNPENYANQPVPAYVSKDNTPEDNVITDLGATLGRVLFYDRRLSRTDEISCASCHRQENAFGDPATASLGVAGTTGRHSMRLVNARFSAEQHFFWDERADSAEDQATMPIRDHIEMGFSGTNGDPAFSDLVVKLAAIEEYRVLFQGVFGDGTVSEERVGKALAQFVRSIQSFDSKYDTGRAVRNDNQNFPNYTATENAGKNLFMRPPNAGGAGCAGCHNPPEFDITPVSGNNGVVGSLGGGSDFTNTRSPSLRDSVGPNGSSHGGFMHDASLPTLLSVIDHYNAIPAIVPGLDPRLRGGGGQPQRLNLSAAEKSELVAFIQTLTGSAIYTDEKFSSPFGSDDTLAAIVLPESAAEMSYSVDENDRQLVTLAASGVPNVDYILQTSEDLDKWTSTAVRATAEGSLEITIPMESTGGRKFYRFAYGVDAD